MSRSKVKRTWLDNKNASHSNTLSSLKISRRMRKRKLKETFQKLSETFKLKINVLKTKQLFKKKRRHILKLKFNNLNKKMKLLG